MGPATVWAVNVTQELPFYAHKNIAIMGDAVLIVLNDLLYSCRLLPSDLRLMLQRRTLLTVRTRL